jgi:hypothetical protein
MDTATEKKVVEERRVKSPLSNNKSHPGDVYFTRIVELVYDDGSSEFCDTERKFFEALLPRRMLPRRSCIRLSVAVRLGSLGQSRLRRNSLRSSVCWE